LRQPIPFGKYYLLERVNVGGMAEVFKAKATGVEGFERLVAVKRILPSIAEDAEFITMFIDEAKIAVQLTHANIAQIFDLGKVDESYFIALEYIHGKDLRAIFNRGRARSEPIPVAMACFCIMKLCEGLEYAHNKRDAAGQFLNLVHRDVSPQNILVSHEGEVKIIDFGIAKAAGKSGRTQAGILKGKFGYMSPEQVQGLDIDRRSDVFGVGICLYELLTGERLFVGESDFATLEKVRNVDIMPPSTYNRRIPPELERIVLQALAKDRTTRYQSAMQLHDALQAFMYSSGSAFGRRDLAMYMQRAFSEEISREDARDQEYASIGVERRDDVTGLTAFDELEAVSSVSALNLEPDDDQPPAAPQSAADMAPAQRFKGKSTLLGLPTSAALAAPPSAPSLRPQSNPSIARPGPAVPPLVPRMESIPPGRSGPPGTLGRNPAAGAAPPRVEMDWDDEEMSTQIYDRPDEPTAGAQPQLGVPAVTSAPLVLAVQPAVVPAAWGAAARSAPAPGAPSPFGPPADSARRTARTEPDLQWPPPGEARERRRIVIALLLAVAMLVLVGGGMWLMRTPSPGTVHLSTTPADVAVALDGMAQTGSSPFVLSQVSPGVAHEIAVTHAGFRTWSLKFQLQPGETMELPPVKLESMESGFVLNSNPAGASVLVDGSLRTQLTPVRIVDLEPGDHHVRIEADGYAPWESSLHVTPGTVLDLPTAQLMPRAAEAAPAPAPVAVAVAVPTPAPASPPPRAAPASPRARRPASPRVASIPSYVPPSAPEPAPAPQPVRSSGGTGTLRVQTRPWSKVLVDGRPVGTTPLTGVTLSAGRHTLTFVNDDFGIQKTVKVEIEAGQVLTKSLNLE
jgi:serine/threonine protein kinase